MDCSFRLISAPARVDALCGEMLMSLHRRPSSSRSHRGFTLVEILIVVIIMGIIASIVIALFNNNVADASEKSLKDNLRNMRSQLQLYSAQHGTYPTVAEFEQQMVLYSDQLGNTS